MPQFGDKLYCTPTPAPTDHCHDGVKCQLSLYGTVVSVTYLSFASPTKGIFSSTPAEEYTDHHFERSHL